MNPFGKWSISQDT